MTRYVVRPLDNRWVIIDSVTHQPYSAPSASLKIELIFCEMVNAVHERLNETARCADHGTFMPCTLKHEEEP